MPATLTRSFLALAALRFAKLGLGVAVLVAYGRLFGVSPQMDAWVFASGLMASLGMLAWGPVNEVTRSRFLARAAQDGLETAMRSAMQLLRLSFLLTLALCIVLWVAAPVMVPALYAGDDPASVLLFTRMFTLLLPSMVLGQLLALGSAFLNCCDVIYAPEWIGIGAGLLSLAAVALTAPLWGTWGLVLGHYLMLGLSVALTAGYLWRKGFRLRRSGPAPWGAVQGDLRFAAPLYASYAAGQGNALAERTLATGLGAGVLASLNYGMQIKSTLQAVLSSVLLSLAVPKLTRAANDATPRAFDAAWGETQRVIALFLLAVLPPLWAGATPLVHLLFGTASLTPAQAATLVDLIRAYLVALLPVALYLVHGAALLARQMGPTYAAWGVGAQALSLGCLLLLLPIVNVLAFPWALALSHTVAALGMAAPLRPPLRLAAEALAWLLLLMAVTGLGVAWQYSALASTLPSLGALVVGVGLHGLALAVLGGAWWRLRRQR